MASGFSRCSLAIDINDHNLERCFQHWIMPQALLEYGGRETDFKSLNFVTMASNMSIKPDFPG